MNLRKVPQKINRRKVRVKRCGKSAPRNWQQLWQGKPHSVQDQIETHLRKQKVCPHLSLGRSLEGAGDSTSREMAVLDKTRLID